MRTIELFSYAATFFISSLAASQCVDEHKHVQQENVEKTWKLETIFKLSSISEVDVAPIGDEAVYTTTQTRLDASNNDYFSQVWRVNLANCKSCKLLAAGGDAFHPRYSPDGNQIAFLSKRDGAKNIYLVTKDEQKPVQLTNVKEGVECFSWSPDGKKLAFVTSVETKKNCVSRGATLVTPSSKVLGLFILSVSPNLEKPKQLTSTEYYLMGGPDFFGAPGFFDWSPDSQKIAFTYTLENTIDSQWKSAQIAIIDINTKEIEKLPRLSPHQANPKYSPNGKWIAFAKSDDQSTYSFIRNIALYSPYTKEVKELQKTPDESLYLYTAAPFGWSRDGKAVLCQEVLQTKLAIWQIPINGGKIKQLDTGGQVIKRPLLSRNRKWLGFSLEDLATPAEAYYSSMQRFSPKQISKENYKFRAYKMPKTEVISWKSFDGSKIEGLITYPMNYDPEKKYPLLLIVHGGPMGVFLESYVGSNRLHSLVAFANEGFVVLRPNPRGSTGYGAAFRSANIGDWGGGDYLDIMAGVDHLIESGIVDENKMGVMGWSYGGYMTAWILTQNGRFAAGVMGAGVSNLLSFSGTTDLYQFVSDYFGDPLWKKPDLYLQRSPILYADRITTPLLILHGEKDERVPLSQSIELFRALQMLKKPVSFVIYPKATHTHLGPILELDAMHRHLDWFITHVKNRDL